jgi:hypothetical protein
MNWLERDTACVWYPFIQHSVLLTEQRTVISRAGESWLYDVDGNRVLDGASLRAGTAADAVPATTATKEPTLPPPDPDEPGGPSPTDPEGPTDPKPTNPTDPTGPDEPPAVGRSQRGVDGVVG